MEDVVVVLLFLNDRDRILLVEAWPCQSLPHDYESCDVYTSQVEEVGVLVELVEDCARSKLQIRTGEDSDRVRWQLFGELLATLVIFERSNVWCDCFIV